MERQVYARMAALPGPPSAVADEDSSKAINGEPGSNLMGAQGPTRFISISRYWYRLGR